MGNNTILLTGATGLVGFRILQEALQKGYQIRLAVRAESKVEDIRKALKAANGLEGAKLETVIVPDMIQSGAFDEAIKGAKYVIHVASPLPGASDDLEATVVKPAIGVTLSMLSSVLHDPSRTVEKVVITSSVAAVVPSQPGFFDADHTEPDPKGPYGNPFEAYMASKKLALNATRKFIAEKNPYFDVINVMPSFVIGRNGFAQSRKDYTVGSNNIALTPLLGGTIPGGQGAWACHVDDVAAVHVGALDPKVKGHRNFGVNYNKGVGVAWDDGIEIVKRRLPEFVGGDGFPLGGSVASHKTEFDASKTEAQLGIKFKDYETMLVDAARGYIEVGRSERL